MFRFQHLVPARQRRSAPLGARHLIAPVSRCGTPPSPGTVCLLAWFILVSRHTSPWEIGVLISSALAWNGTPGTGNSGGAVALSIILAAAITVLLIYVAQKKWRRRRQLRRGGGE